MKPEPHHYHSELHQHVRPDEKSWKRQLNQGRFHHDGNPIMTRCIGNVVGKTIPGNDDVVKPVKEQAENKIDGAVALTVTIGRAMLKRHGDFPHLLIRTMIS